MKKSAHSLAQIFRILDSISLNEFHVQTVVVEYFSFSCQQHKNMYLQFILFVASTTGTFGHGLFTENVAIHLGWRGAF